MATVTMLYVPRDGWTADDLPDRYREAGRSGGLVQVDEPWTVEIDVDALVT